MNPRNIQLMLVTLWLAIVIYDLAIWLPDWSFVPVQLFWIATVVATVLWSARLPPANIYVIFSSLCVVTFVVFVSYAQTISFLDSVSLQAEFGMHKIIWLIMESVIASGLIALITSPVLAVIFCKNFFILAILVSLPLSAFQVYDLPSKLAGQAILVFEIFFRVFALWIGCIITNKILVKKLIR